MSLSFIATTPSDPAALGLLGELNLRLATLTGSSGEASFSAEDAAQPKSAFLLATTDGVAEACGALRRVDEQTCEVKRMYVRRGRAGLGTLMLAELERRAAAFGYSRIVLETRKVNTVAVSFYLKHHYKVIPNYGKYAGNELAICFEKQLTIQ